MSPDEKAVWNERTKLTCTAINNAAVATIVTGVVVPLISAFNSPGPIDRLLPDGFLKVVAIVWWLGFGVLVHAGALSLMRRIKG